MHEAEETLDADDCSQYVHILDQIHPTATIHKPMPPSESEYEYEVFALVHATPIQRAEAFLRVKGLWKE